MSSVARADYFIWYGIIGVIIIVQYFDNIDGVIKFQPIGALLSYIFSQSELSIDSTLIYVETGKEEQSKDVDRG